MKSKEILLTGGQTIKDYSEKMAESLDDYVKKTLDERYKDVKDTLNTYKGAIETMVAALYEEETIEGAKVRDIIKSYENENNLPTRLQEINEEHKEESKQAE